jgi:hypothetical protein
MQNETIEKIAEKPVNDHVLLNESSSSYNDSKHIIGEESAREHMPVPTCRCGCVPKNMKSLFEMAALRAEYRRLQSNKAIDQNSGSHVGIGES